ncbi:hypothetical protein Gohar_025541 [Gossypium harknessii]|uniref:Uncharacterized protein n=1 Tax=Gossypium harknessii TaxID=34285 RepID=A0A7J9I8Q2_9ROSI|nr:hypothetical protein [Gossypium harknessii]
MSFVVSSSSNPVSTAILLKIPTRPVLSPIISANAHLSLVFYCSSSNRREGEGTVKIVGSKKLHLPSSTLDSGNLRQKDWQVYERVEGEKQRMQFAKDLELQRVRMKRSWGQSGEAYSSS